MKVETLKLHEGSYRGNGCKAPVEPHNWCHGQGHDDSLRRRRTGKKRVDSTKDQGAWSYDMYGCALGPAHGLGVTLTVTIGRLKSVTGSAIRGWR
jgi:hypothetical protein